MRSFLNRAVWLLAVIAMASAATGCGGGAGSSSDGDLAIDGDTTVDGDGLPDGDAADGDRPYLPDGDVAADGDTTVDGDSGYPDGDGESMADGDLALDGDVTVDGDGPSEGEADGDSGPADGDGENGEGETEGEEPLLQCPENRDPYVMYLSNDDSNSVAGPVLVRWQVGQGRRPSPQYIRTWEFLNYYQVPYPAPAAGELVSVHADLAANADPGVYRLQLAVRAPDQDSRDGRPVSLTFILDTSGSMGGRPIELLRAVCRSIAGQLNAGDTVSMVSWSTRQNVILSGHRVAGPDDRDLLRTIDSLSADGGTDLHAGLVTGYQLARAAFRPDGLNRVVLISDGMANTGQTDDNLIAAEADDSEGEGIYLTGVMVGNEFNFPLMEKVTDRGRGAFIFVDDAEEAARMFGPRFLENMEIAAMAVTMEATLPWYFRMAEFHGEQWGTDPDEVEPQHLAPNDAMVFHQTVRACDPAEVKEDDAIAAAAIYTHPRTRQRARTEVSFRIDELLAQANERAVKGDAIVAYAGLLGRSARFQANRPEIEELAATFRARYGRTDDGDYLEMAQVLDRLAAIVGR